MRQVGSLSGKNVIYNLGKIDLSEFDRFYQGVTEEAFTSSSRVDELGGGDEIDPYDPNLFKDEIIDIDFGAIDAYTAGLNAQINAEKSGANANGQLQFPSHILTSNHATFIDNQMFLGDPFYSQSVSNGHESSSNLNGNNSSNQNGVSYDALLKMGV